MSRRDEFKIPAWPFIYHVSNERTGESRTDVLWPLIEHRKTSSGKTTFNIRPFLFYYEKDRDRITVALFFYTLYFFFDNLRRIIFLLPFFTYINYELQTTSKQLHKATAIILAGLVAFKSNSNSRQYFHIFPFYFHVKKKQEFVFQLCLLLFWRVKLDDGRLTFLLPFIWHYASFSPGKDFFIHIWPLFGYRKVQDLYVEYVTLYPFFRFRKTEGAMAEEPGFAIHLMWPFVKINILKEKKTFRIIPFIYVRFMKEKNQGFMLIFYWSHEFKQNFMVGLLPFFHLTFNLEKRRVTALHILLLVFFLQDSTSDDGIVIIPVILLIYLWNRDGTLQSERRVLSLLILFYVESTSYMQQTKQITKRTLILVPFIFYRTNDFLAIVPVFIRTETSEISRTYILVLLTYIQQSKREKEDILVLTFPIFLVSKDKYRRLIFCWLFFERSYQKNQEINSFRSILGPLFLQYHSYDPYGHSLKTTFLLAPLVCHSKRDDKLVVFALPLIWLSFDIKSKQESSSVESSSVTSQPAKSSKAVLRLLVFIPLLAFYYRTQELFMVSLLFPLTAHARWFGSFDTGDERKLGWRSATWILPLFIAMRDIVDTTKEQVFQIVLIPLAGYIRKAKTISFIGLLFCLFGVRNTAERRTFYVLPLLVFSTNYENVTVTARPNSTVGDSLPSTSADQQEPVSRTERRRVGGLYFVLPLFIYYYEKEMNMSIILPLLAGSYYAKGIREVKVLPFLTLIRHREETYVYNGTNTDKPKYHYDIAVLLCGLIGGFKRHSLKRFWIGFFLIYSHSNASHAADETSVFALPLLPIYVRKQKGNNLHLVLPFYLYIETHDVLFILPPLIRVHKSEEWKLHVICYLIFEYKHDLRRRKFRLRLLFFLGLSLLRLHLDRTRDFDRVHLQTWKAYIFPIFYLNVEHVMTHRNSTSASPLVSDSSQHYSMQHGRKQEFLEGDEYSAALPSVTFNLLWLWKGYGLVTIIHDTASCIYLYSLVPLFRIEYDKSSLRYQYLIAAAGGNTHQNMLYPDTKSSNVFSISLLWCLSPWFSLMYYERELENRYHNDSSLRYTFYIFILLHWSHGIQFNISNPGNYEQQRQRVGLSTGHKLTVRTQVSLLWLMLPEASLIRYKHYFNQLANTNAYTFYILLLIWYNQDSSLSATTNILAYEKHFSLLWLFHKRVSIFGVVTTKSVQKRDDSVLSSNIWGYLCPIVYIAYHPTHHIFKLLFIPSSDKYPLGLLNYRVDWRNNSGILPFRLQSPKARQAHIMFLFYLEEEYTTVQNERTRMYEKASYYYQFLWIFYKRIAVLHVWHHPVRTSNEKSTGLFILLLVSFYRRKTAAGNISTTFALLWLFTSKIALVHYSNKKKGRHETIIPLRGTDLELQETSRTASVADDLPQPVAPHNIDARARAIKKVEYDDKEFWFYILFLFYVNKSGGLVRGKMLKFSFFWLFIRQLAFFRLTDERTSNGYYKITLFPLFKYERKTGVYSRWALIPLIPIKYSFVATILAYEKTVNQKGTVDQRTGKENKKARVNQVQIRFIYRVFRYEANGTAKTIEFQPWFSYEFDAKDKFKSWDLCGGITGYNSERGRRCCCCCYS